VLDQPSAGQPGTVIAAHGEELQISTGAGVLRLVEVQPEARRPMSVRDFLAGHRMAPGDRLSGR
jgi:methionyl-tRNA formyltransferase